MACGLLWAMSFVIAVLFCGLTAEKMPRWGLAALAVALASVLVGELLSACAVNATRWPVDTLKIGAIVAAFLAAACLARFTYQRWLMSRAAWTIWCVFVLVVLCSYKTPSFLLDKSLIDSAEVLVKGIGLPESMVMLGNGSRLALFNRSTRADQSTVSDSDPELLRAAEEQAEEYRVLYKKPFVEGFLRADDPSFDYDGTDVFVEQEVGGNNWIRFWEEGASELQALPLTSPIDVFRVWIDLSGNTLVVVGRTADTAGIWELATAGSAYQPELVAEVSIGRMIFSEPLSPSGEVLALPGAQVVRLDNAERIMLPQVEDRDYWTVPVWAPEAEQLVYLSQDWLKLLFVGSDLQVKRQVTLPERLRDPWLRLNNEGDVCYVSSQNERTLMVVYADQSVKTFRLRGRYFRGLGVGPVWVDDRRIAYLVGPGLGVWPNPAGSIFLLDTQTGQSRIVSEPRDQVHLFTFSRSGGVLSWLSLGYRHNAILRLRLPAVW